MFGHLATTQRVPKLQKSPTKRRGRTKIMQLRILQHPVPLQRTVISFLFPFSFGSDQFADASISRYCKEANFSPFLICFFVCSSSINNIWSCRAGTGHDHKHSNVEKKKRPKDVFGRPLPTEEEFEVLKNAPRYNSSFLF